MNSLITPSLHRGTISLSCATNQVSWIRVCIYILFVLDNFNIIFSFTVRCAIFSGCFGPTDCLWAASCDAAVRRGSSRFWLVSLSWKCVLGLCGCFSSLCWLALLASWMPWNKFLLTFSGQSKVKDLQWKNKAKTDSCLIVMTTFHKIIHRHKCSFCHWQVLPMTINHLKHDARRTMR